MSIRLKVIGSSRWIHIAAVAWARIPRASAGDVNRAVGAANDAMWNGPWASMTPTARGKVMRKLGDLVAENAQSLAEIEVRITAS